MRHSGCREVISPCGCQRINGDSAQGTRSPAGRLLAARAFAIEFPLRRNKIVKTPPVVVRHGIRITFDEAIA